MTEIADEQFVHFHIPKTAGTSLRASFVRQFGAEKVGMLLPGGELVRTSDIPLRIEQVDRIRRLTRRLGMFNLYGAGMKLLNRGSLDATFELADIKEQGISVAMGHFKAEDIPGAVKHLPRTTVVRDPLARAFSHYAYWKESEGTSWWHEGNLPYSENVSFEEFVNDPLQANYQTRRLGGLSFDAVGVSSDIPAFFGQIGLSPRSYLPFLNPSRYGLPAMDAGFVREFEDANRADYELYEQALERV